MFELKDRVALVTGGSRGIGKAVALALAEVGAAVAVNYRERGEEAEAVTEAVRQAGGRAAAFGTDVSLRTGVESMVHDIEERLGPIDILVNNAGVATARGLEDITEEDFDRDIAVNLKSAFLCTQAVLPGMRRSTAANTVANGTARCTSASLMKITPLGFVSPSSNRCGGGPEPRSLDVMEPDGFGKLLRAVGNLLGSERRRQRARERR